MTNQEIVFNEVKVKGECWHIIANPLNNALARLKGIEVAAQFADEQYCKLCKLEYLDCPKELKNTDLTTPEGMVWLLKRVSKWDKRMRFDAWLTSTINVRPCAELSQVVIYRTMRWLSDPSNLFNALCEFLKVDDD